MTDYKTTTESKTFTESQTPSANGSMAAQNQNGSNIPAGSPNWQASNSGQSSPGYAGGSIAESESRGGVTPAPDQNSAKTAPSS